MQARVIVAREEVDAGDRYCSKARELGEFCV